MSVSIPNKVMDIRLSLQGFRIYAQLSYLCSKLGKKEVAVTQTELSDMCNLSRVTVIKYLKELVDEGLIDIQSRKRTDGGNDANIYVLKEIE